LSCSKEQLIKREEFKMKKKIVGLALTAVVALGSMSAFAADGATGAQQGKANRAGKQYASAECTGENRASRLQSIVEGLEAAGKGDIAAKLQEGEFETVREAIESLTEEENLAVRETMRELKLNGKGNASGKGMAKRDGSMGLCQ
jgi:hypothetical protein